jgi:molybdopterin-containing oxidoreductase family iron-sulfur binding subunit
MPYVRQPEDLVLGKPLFYATTRALAGYGTGLLVESHEGRPTKIEGNPQHPASLGATDVFSQAAVLDLYDPDRSRTISFRGRIRTWSAVTEELRRRLAPKSPRGKGKGLALLTETVSSPTLAWQLAEFKKDHNYPEARWFRYEPAGDDNARAGAALAFGQPAHVRYHLARADVMVALDSDLLGSGPGHLAYSRDYSARRREGGTASKAGMNRLYSVESSLTITGAKADNRLALRPSQIEGFARALAKAVGVAGVEAPKLEPEVDRWVQVLARDLTARQAGATLVAVGPGQRPEVHALALAINDKLGNLGHTVVVTDPVTVEPPEGSMESLRALYDAIDGGEVDTLFILGGNPAYTAPADVPFANLLEKKLEDKDWLSVYLGLYHDETARLCHWHIAEAHFLESWSDARADDGTASVVQPLIAPLYAGRSAHEVLGALSHRAGAKAESPHDYDDRTPYELVRDYWRTHRPEPSAKIDFEHFWRQALHDGVIAGTALPAGLTRAGKVAPPELVADLAKRIGEAPSPAGQEDTLELVFAPDPGVYDGRFANNGWLQEFPKPLTRLTWDNAALLSPATARELGVGDGIGHWKGGEHGDTKADTVRLEVDGRRLDAPAFILPGQPDGVVTLHLGYGRQRAGRVGGRLDPAGRPEERIPGVDANQLRTTKTANTAGGVRVTKVGHRNFDLACVQAHHNMQGRDIVRSATLKQLQEDPHFATSHGHGEHPAKEGEGKRVPLETLYPPDHPYPTYKWGMAIDLSACTGCGACVVACQAENNIPVVGKDQVTRGREMHWLRIDRYFESPRTQARSASQGQRDQLRVHFQPVPCMHCENAPCEVVCPVEATVHGDEGTNDMVYNRCVGTRYCSNNCPYKVRRFNFLQYADFTTPSLKPSLKLLHNPDVTVRSRGVMEKCTYCIQRISYARIEASKEALDEAELAPNRRRRHDKDRPGVAVIHDGEVVTACQAACPAEAIVFGDLNDPRSRVHRLQESNLNYALLRELNTRPRTTYLAAVGNPNPELGTK